MRIVVSFILMLLITTGVKAQVEDTTLFQQDTTYSYDTTYAEYEYDSIDSTSASSSYTQRPGELNPTKKELARQYANKKFSKSEWKKIVGETKYTEDPNEEKQDDKKDKPYKGSSAVWGAALLKIIGFALIVLLILAIIFFLIKNASLENRATNSVSGESLLYDNQHIDEITESELDRLLREAIERKDFRVAVRLYYIRLLKHLNATGFISWKKDKTNHDYAAELSTAAFIRDFRKLMIAYEIIWYGERTPSAEEFSRLQTNFSEVQRQATRTV